MSGVVLWTVRQQFGWQATDDSSADAAAAVASPFHYTRVALLGAGVGGSVAVYTAATCKEGFAAAIALPGGLEEGSIPGYEMIDRRLEQCAQMNDAVDAKWGVRWLCENGDGVSQWALAYCLKEIEKDEGGGKGKQSVNSATHFNKVYIQGVIPLA